MKLDRLIEKSPSKQGVVMGIGKVLLPGLEDIREGDLTWPGRLRTASSNPTDHNTQSAPLKVLPPYSLS